MKRFWAMLAALISMQHAADADAAECRWLGVEPDGALQVEMGGKQRLLQIYGVLVPQPPSALYMDIVGKRLAALQAPLRCALRAAGPQGQCRAKVLYLAWRDKSGDVWQDLALTLLEQGVVRVSDEKFPEREEYVRHQRR